jgi:hypothetical protein
MSLKRLNTTHLSSFQGLENCGHNPSVTFNLSLPIFLTVVISSLFTIPIAASPFSKHRPHPADVSELSVHSVL